MLSERCLFYDFIVEIAVANLHHQECLLSANVETVRWQDVGMPAEEVDFTFINKKIEFDLLLSKGLHRQNNTVYV
jgi:hypothetical protein